MRKKLQAEFHPEERQKFDDFETENQREGFSIVRAFAGLAERRKERDFQISRASLADRLSMTPPGAGKVILKLCEQNIIAQTQHYVRHKAPARFCWVLPRGEASQCDQLNHAPATDCNQGPPSDCNVIAAGAPLLNGAQKDMPQVPLVAGVFEAQ